MLDVRSRRDIYAGTTQIIENLEERFTEDELTEVLQLVEQSFLIAPPSTLEASQTTQTTAAGTTENRVTESHANGADDADAIWDSIEGDGMENYLVHETGGGQDDLEMDDTEE